MFALTRFCLLVALSSGHLVTRQSRDYAGSTVLRQVPIQGKLPTIDDEVKKATEAAKAAWQLVKEVAKQTKENNEFPPMVKAQVALAKTAALQAKAADEAAIALVAKTQVAADAAALEAAKAYYKEVQIMGAKASADAAKAKTQQAIQAEINAAKAAAAAAMPYHQAILRGQKVIVEYQFRVAALSAASTNLKVEAKTLAAAAPGYQSMGQPVQANQMMMQANALYNRGAALKAEAESLHSSVTSISGSLGAYQLAEQAAADAAAANANPPVLPEVDPLPY